MEGDRSNLNLLVLPQVWRAGIINRVDVTGAISRTSIMKLISPDDTLALLSQFRSEWKSFQRSSITDNTVIRDDALAAEHNLRGYGATHQACALILQET